MEHYPKRWELADNSSIPHHINQLYRYFGSGDDLQVDCVLHNQFFIYKDTSSGSKGFWQNPDQKPEVKGNLFPFTNFASVVSDKSQPVDETILFHKQSKLIVTGHQFQFVYKPVGYKTPNLLWINYG